MTELAKLTIEKARDGLRKKAFSSAELTNSCLNAIQEAKGLNAFVHDTPEIAIKQATDADKALGQGDTSSMCGIPIGIKDLFCTKGVASQAASKILQGFKPEYESTTTPHLEHLP